MRPEITDVRQRLEYGHTHELARQLLPVALFGVLLGLFLLTSFSGRALPGKHVFGGWLALLLSFVFMGVIVYRRVQPSVPNIVLSPQGVLFRELSEKVIPWSEIEEVGVARVSTSRDLFGIRVTKLVVSEPYFNSLGLSVWTPSVIAMRGDRCEIYLAYHTPPPLDEFQTAVRCRWQAFSRHASDRTAQFAMPQAAQKRRNGGVIERAQSFTGIRALAAMVRESSPGQLLAIVVALAGIVTLATNNLGLWSTAAQLEGRAKAEEWRQWRVQREAEQKAFDEEQRRVRERFDRMYRCMDRTWDQDARGNYKKHPDCL